MILISRTSTPFRELRPGWVSGGCKDEGGLWLTGHVHGLVEVDGDDG